MEKPITLRGSVADGWSEQPVEVGRHAGLAQTTIARDTIRSQLARMLASADFDASARNRRFLEIVVEEALAGCADRIKTYGIATGVSDATPISIRRPIRS